jgi:hypothetical protein
VTQNRKSTAQFTTLLISGSILYFATDNAIAGAVLPSVHAAWKSFRTGLWVLNVDPDRTRARICSAFYAATALWQAAAAAFGSVLVFILIASLTGKEPDMNDFIATMVVLTSGVVLTTVLGLIAIFAAAVNAKRVWIHPKLRQKTRNDLLNIAALPGQIEFNYAIFVLATSLAFPVLAFSCLLLIDPASDVLAPVLLLFGVCISVVVYCWLSSRIIAQHPAECWGPDTLQ